MVPTGIDNSDLLERLLVSELSRSELDELERAHDRWGRHLFAWLRYLQPETQWQTRTAFARWVLDGCRSVWRGGEA